MSNIDCLSIRYVSQQALPPKTPIQIAPAPIINMTPPTARRTETIYLNPLESLTLKLVLCLDDPLPIASVRSCLNGASAQARTRIPNAPGRLAFSKS